MSKAIDITNQRFGRLVAIKKDHQDKRNKWIWECRCDCGSVIYVRASNLVNGQSQSCGCIQSPDITGKKFGKLTAICKARPDKYGWIWKCKCDCGKISYVSIVNLTHNITRSCGCLHKETMILLKTTHNLSRTKIYKVWRGMKSRCYNKNNKAYKHYGGRGITVCEEWKNDFMSFYNWANDSGYKQGLTIERINNDGDYCPKNCSWVTQSDQCRNQRTTVFVKFREKQWVLSNLIRVYNLPVNMYINCIPMVKI